MENKYATPFMDFLKSDRQKFVIFISRKQYAIVMDNGLTHDEMIKQLVNMTRPNEVVDELGMPLDPNNSYINDTIVILGYRNPLYVQVQFPERDKISQEQFNCFKELVDTIKEYKKINKDPDSRVCAFANNGFKIETKDYINNLDELLNNISNYVVDTPTNSYELVAGRSLIEKENIVENNIEDKEHVLVKTQGYGSFDILLLFTLLSSITFLVIGILLFI